MSQEIDMSNELDAAKAGKPGKVEFIRKVSSVDFSYQFNAARDFQKVEKSIFTLLSEISRKNFKEKRSIGLIIVLGVFDKSDDHLVPGMRQIGVNPIQKYINICEDVFTKDIFTMLNEGADGAIIVNRNGQVIGSKIYLVVDDSSLDVPDGCGTRHISAASFSTRDDIIAVFTLSEETSVVRTWKNGTFVEQFDPSDE
jgi:DNA integrity scanning protein DisA with diadenylate cyclase activity